MTAFIHPTAVIDEGAQIGAGTRIWHFSHLMPGCILGEKCNIGQNVYIDKNVVIGNRVKIQNNVSVYNGVTLEDDVFIGPSAVFTNVINPRSFIERKDEFRRTIVRKGASIGANATIVCGIEIGSYAMIGAGAVITKDVPAYGLLVGNPAVRTGWVSEAGHKLAFDINGFAHCPGSDQTYLLQNETVSLIK
jgi:UDP-2-acetamido-3-amino-2,3-dideoxy-glucuronate N-acetyltransferase